MTIVIVVVIVLIQAILALGHVILFKFLVSAFAINSQSVLLYLKIILSCLAISFIAASLFAFKFYNPATRWFYTLAAVWLGVLFYLSLAALSYWLLVLLATLLWPTLPVVLMGKILIVLALLVSGWGVINANNIKVTSINVKLPNNSWQDKRAVWVSDVHLGHVHGLTFLNQIIEQVNGLKPDIIFIGGDVYDGTAFPLELTIKPLKKLSAPLGTYFITGNHEEFGNNNQYLDTIEKSDVKVLNNEVIDIEGVQIVGVDYNDSTKQEKFSELISSLNINTNKPSILLKHAPFHLSGANENGIDLLLAGHTHKAQMFPLNLISWLVYRGYDYGLKKYNNITVYTSSGVGTWGPPLKVGNPAEIVLINFE